MNKKWIDEHIDIAYRALKECKIVDEKNRIKKTFRGQISTFGAAVTTGSLLSAVAFFSDGGGASVERPKLLKAIYYILCSEEERKNNNQWENTTLYNFIKQKQEQTNFDIIQCKEQILDAAISLKLAMNLYELFKKGDEKDKNDEVS